MQVIPGIRYVAVESELMVGPAARILLKRGRTAAMVVVG